MAACDTQTEQKDQTGQECKIFLKRPSIIGRDSMRKYIWKEEPLTRFKTSALADSEMKWKAL